MDQNIYFVEILKNKKIIGCFFINTDNNKNIRKINYFPLNNITDKNNILVTFFSKIFKDMKNINTIFHFLDKIENLSIFKNLKIDNKHLYTIGYY